MWQRFSERARKAVFFAQEEAQNSGEGYVSSEHLLLGVLREGDSTASRILEALGVSPNRVRVEVEKEMPKGEPKPGQDMTLTPRAKRVIDLAYEEARGLNHNYIGTEHLLLGLIREGQGLAARVLQQLGVDVDRVRAAIRAMPDRTYDQPRNPTAPPVDPWEGFEDDARGAVVLAGAAALGRGQIWISPEHVLLGLLDLPECAAVQALRNLGVDLERLRAETEGRCRTGRATPDAEAFLSPATNEAILLAYKEQTRAALPKTTTRHLLLGLLREPDGVAGRVLEAFGVTADAIRESSA